MGELAEGSAAPHYWGTSSTGGVAPEPAAMYRDYLARPPGKKDEFGNEEKDEFGNNVYERFRLPKETVAAFLERVRGGSTLHGEKEAKPYAMTIERDETERVGLQPRLAIP